MTKISSTFAMELISGIGRWLLGSFRSFTGFGIIITVAIFQGAGGEVLVSEASVQNCCQNQQGLLRKVRKSSALPGELKTGPCGLFSGRSGGLLFIRDLLSL